MAAEDNQSTHSRGLLALMRRIFQRCQGKPVNNHSRQMTPEEAMEFHDRMAAHGVQNRKGSSVNEVQDKAAR